MIEVTLPQFKEVLKDLLLSGKNRTVILIEEDEPWLATTYHIKEGKFRDVETVLEHDEVLPWLTKKGHPTYRLVDEEPHYFRVFNDDTESVLDFVAYAKTLGGHTSVLHQRPEIVEILTEMVSMYRISERSGYSLAEMYCDDIELTPREYTLDEPK